ncbi:hypothetical protein OV203_13360 [Nannocystis sp. ILAH1]|uniref:CFI-box-CTERM domain-containing protein n=1 Tax=unclassified Nannocystis TaxID=2627009 RepID=UPI00226F64AF|nr:MULTISPECIES: CFI-box-CTERM domain-containing protein [unclassified Nannocystis]MCY0988120.1 hypothetical protein [Nannocystis sp. ILAH1]MCY1065500.1 hypothetical protein [Nannocystis sp. RBIL2]
MPRSPMLPLAALLLGLTPASRAAAADEPVLVEFHFTPVPGAQIAVWLEDANGEYVQDVMVTQAVGKYGIGNRPGIWNFLSSWRAPYGPRVSVLPVWAHRRGKTYPKIILHDEDPGDLDSLGFHENTSSDEPYFCRPLSPSEHETISVDTMTCPSPKVFNSDKGQFDPGGDISWYPPRNDILMYDPAVDAEEIQTYAELNDLDAVTAATPPGDQATFVTVLVRPEAMAEAPLTAYLEIGVEADENAAYSFDRDNDHYVDPDLSAYGVEYLGQPSVVYAVPFDPYTKGFRGTSDYAGYADWDGATGTLHPPDATISAADGSGADRLQVMTKNGETFRWGVYSHGGPGEGGTTSSASDSDSGSDSDTGGATGAGSTTGDDPGDGWGSCAQVQALVPVEDLVLVGESFDRVQVSFRLPPPADPTIALKEVQVFSIASSASLTEDLLGAAHQSSFAAAELNVTEGLVTVEVGELWADYTYQFGVRYEDACTNRSPLVMAQITTEAQKFQTVDTFCFLATAAWGAPWAAQVAALRAFRDDYLKTTPTGVDLIRFYYAHSPPLARVIAREPLLRGLARVVLQPVADAALLATAGG